MAVTPQDLSVTAALPPNLEMAETDPAHPRNLLYTTTALRQQAIGDTRYDILQPTNTVSSVPGTIRESFCNTCHSQNHHGIATLGAGFTAIIVGALAYLIVKN